MRIGDFAVEVVSRGKGVGVREIGSGHVLARPGQVYALRIRNLGPLRCVADVTIDGRSVSAGGLVIEAWATEELERPISPDDDGYFTVVAEGNERAFGPDGGRDNPDLGLIEVRFRRELPSRSDRVRPLPPMNRDTLDRGPIVPTPAHPSRLPSEFSPFWNRSLGEVGDHDETIHVLGAASHLRSPASPEGPIIAEPTLDDVEGAAGTGLTGHSTQTFRATQVGPLEREATVIQLRIVIGSAEAITAATQPYEVSATPERPAPRP